MYIKFVIYMVICILLCTCLYVFYTHGLYIIISMYICTFYSVGGYVSYHVYLSKYVYFYLL